MSAERFMPKPSGYFAHEQKIKTQAQMIEALKARTSSAVSRSEKSLVWLKPQGRTQRTEHEPYEIRGARTNDQLWYYAWVTSPKPKLLGYSPDPSIARTHCEAHYLNVTRGPALSSIVRTTKD